VTEEFDERYFERLAAARGHWWTRGMQEVGAALLAGRVPPGGVVLDDGCGTGGSLPLLTALAPRRIHALDVAWPAVRSYRAVAPAALVVLGSAARLPYADATFDAVVCADVLQHLPREEAAAALPEVARVLRPGARALLRTGAAWGRRGVPERADWRLYTPDELGRAVVAAGLVPERITHANALPALWARLPRPRRPALGRGHGALPHGLGIPGPAGRLAAALGSRALRLEARWLRRPGRAIPFGHTLFAVARKPG
jgi:SAM-dependent methyltransferase